MKISWKKALSVWWSTCWRGALYGVLAGFILGAIGGVIAAVTGNPGQASAYGTVGGYIGSIPASMLAVKQASQNIYCRWQTLQIAKIYDLALLLRIKSKKKTPVVTNMHVSG